MKKKEVTRVEKSMPRIPAPPKPARRFNPPPAPIARIARPNVTAGKQNEQPIKNIHEPVVKAMKRK